MKKILLLLAVAVTSLTGCSSKAEEMKFATEYTIENQLTFEAIETGVIKQIEPTKKAGFYTYYAPQNSNNNMLNLTFKMKNISDKEIKISDVTKGQIEFGDSKNELNFLGESAELNTVSTNVKIAPQETHFIHIYCEIPKDNKDKEATLTMELLEQDYEFTFSLETPNIKSEEKKIGDTIESETLAITLNKTSETKRLEPSDKSSTYTYYDVLKKDETFIVIEAIIKNKTKESLNRSDVLHISEKIGDEEFVGTVIKESDTKRTLSEAYSFDANKETKCYLIISVKDDLLTKDGTVKILLDDMLYTIAL